MPFRLVAFPLKTAQALLVALLVLATAATALAQQPHRGRVSWVYDGDTLRVDGIGRVRLLGIDAPESKASPRDRFYRRWDIPPQRLRQVARESLRYNIRMAKGKNVTLVTDGEEHDQYGRLLAYVILPDGRNLNLLLLEEGLASVFRRYDFSLKNEFLGAEEKARRQQRGLWAP